MRSAIDDLPGVGPSRRKALLEKFGHLRALRAATVEQLAETDGIGPKLAAQIIRSLKER